MVCNWFIVSIHSGTDKTKSILFDSKYEIKNSQPLNIQYNDIKTKQYSKVTYLACILDEFLSGESMAINVINKINPRLKFLYRQNRFVYEPLRRLLCNAINLCNASFLGNAWYPNVNKKLKTVLQVAQNKCKRIWLKFNDRSSI